MDKVRLPRDAIGRYPHEFSGGQRQRIGIARALAPGADLIICDEAVSALDVSVKAQIINLLVDLQDELGLALLFISHDLAIVEHLTHRVAVMYLGKIVELADRRTLFAQSHHPYTRALLSAVPVPDPTAKRQRIILTGDVPSPINPPSRLPVPHALPVRVRPLPGGGAAAAAGGRRARVGVPSAGGAACGSGGAGGNRGELSAARYRRLALIASSALAPGTSAASVQRVQRRIHRLQMRVHIARIGIDVQQTGHHFAGRMPLLHIGHRADPVVHVVFRMQLAQTQHRPVVLGHHLHRAGRVIAR